MHMVNGQREPTQYCSKSSIGQPVGGEQSAACTVVLANALAAFTREILRSDTVCVGSLDEPLDGCIVITCQLVFLSHWR